MKDKKSTKIFYIHGYQSSPQAQKAVVFNRKLNATAIQYRKGATAIQYRKGEPQHLVISECLTNIHQSIQHEKNVTLIGSSLGGFLAAKTALHHSNIKKIFLLNPAIIPPSTNLDDQTDVPKRILKDMCDTNLFEKRIPAKIIIIRGTQDTVVPDKWIIEFAKAQQAPVIFLDDDHRLSINLNHLPHIIQKYLD
jgi:predicted esterase YcpF (UPF0227 family)